MEINEAIEVLKEHQKWRLGAEIPMQEPKLITKSIDVILEHLKRK